MLVGRHTTAQSGEIQSFGVHLSVGKERVRIGCSRSCARTNPWFRGRILGEKRAQEPTPGSAVEHCRFLDTGGGGVQSCFHGVIPHETALARYAACKGCNLPTAVLCTA